MNKKQDKYGLNDPLVKLTLDREDLRNIENTLKHTDQYLNQRKVFKTKTNQDILLCTTYNQFFTAYKHPKGLSLESYTQKTMSIPRLKLRPTIRMNKLQPLHSTVTYPIR